MKIVVLSDTHNLLYPLDYLPEADLLIHAGDATARGTLQEVEKFGKWLTEAREKYPEVIFVPGNHDKMFDSVRSEQGRELCKSATILINESYEYMGFTFYGSPICPPFGPWAFYWHDFERLEFWRDLEAEPDILVTHGPGYGILDKVADATDWYGRPRDEHVGCRYLAEYSRRVEPLLHVSGHIHEAAGVHVVPLAEGGRITHLNASCRDERYKTPPTHKPYLVEIDGDYNVTTKRIQGPEGN